MKEQHSIFGRTLPKIAQKDIHFIFKIKKISCKFLQHRTQRVALLASLGSQFVKKKKKTPTNHCFINY